MSSTNVPPGVEVDVFGVTSGGDQVRRFTLRNDKGMTLRVIDWGAIVTEWHAPGREGETADVVLGYDELAPYETNPTYFGCAVGRCANRIAKGRCVVDGRELTLATNNGPNHLHGGERGFDKRLWRAETVPTDDGPGIRFQLHSQNGEEGYPGAVDVTMTYVLTRDGALDITYAATCTEPTPLNLTNHTYFNLAGQDSGDVLGHLMQIHAKEYTPVDETLIPTGEIRSVEGTPFDFTEPKPVGRDIEEAGGYDHNFVLKREADRKLGRAARVEDPKSGRVLEVLTSEPGVQFYSGNFLDGTITGKGGAVYEKHAGFCLETQKFPDAVHHPEFPPVVLRPGETYTHRCIYRLGVA